jgi:hypothetical protein
MLHVGSEDCNRDFPEWVANLLGMISRSESHDYLALNLCKVRSIFFHRQRQNPRHFPPLIQI